MRKSIRSPLLALALTVVFAGTALATPASGFHPTLLSRGTMSEPLPVDIVTATVTIDAPASSGWHAHPGFVFVTVVSGSLVQYDGRCTATVHDAGSAFIETGDAAGLVRNESTTTPAVVYVTYIVPTGTPDSGLRIDKDNPGCEQS